MSGIASLAKAARERKAKNMQKHGGQQNQNNNAAKKPSLVGAIPELDVFDYTNNRIDVVKFNEAKRKVAIYVGTHFGVNAHVLEHGTDFVFTPPEQPDAAELEEDEDPHGLRRSMYLEDYKSYRKKVDHYEDNKPKVFNILKGQCSVSMRNMLKRVDNWTEIEEEKDPLALWLEMVNISMNGTAVADDAEKRIIDATRRFQTFRQQNRETVGEFYERFEVEYEAFLGSGARLVQVEIPVAMPEHDAELLHDEIGRREEKQKALHFMNKLDRSRFGGMVDELQNAFDRGRNEYPITLNAAYQMAINFRENGRRVDSVVQVKEQYGAAFITGQGKKGGWKQRKNQESSNNNGETSEESDEKNSKLKCYLCKQAGHIRPNCPYLKKAKEYLDKEQQKTTDALMMSGAHYSACTECIVSSLSFMSEEKKTGRFNFHRNDVHLDTQSSVNVFCNPELLSNIRESDVWVHIYGVNKEGAPLRTNLIGDFAWFGPVSYCPGAMTNILSFFEVANIAKSVWYEKKGNSIKVELKNGEVVPFKVSGKHYVHRVGIKSKKVETAMIDTVENNKLKFTKREIEKAKEAADLYEILGRPSYKDYIHAVNRGSIMNCPITAKDISRAIEIWGVDLGSIKGKTVRTTPEHVPTVEMVGSFSDKEVMLCVDLCKIRGLEFFLSISRRLCLLAVIYLPDRGQKSVGKALDAILSVYGRFGIAVKALYCDGEGAVTNLKTSLEARGVIVETTSKNEHVAEAERSIRMLKERVRSFVTTLPYELPNMMIIHLVYYCVLTINSFPRTSSIGLGVPPKELLTGRKLDFQKDCLLKFGAYVQVHEDDMITNTMKERTLGAIALGPAGNVQGSYNFLSLKTWKVVKRRAWTTLPMPTHVIELVNKKAADDIAELKRKGVVFELDDENSPTIGPNPTESEEMDEAEQVLAQEPDPEEPGNEIQDEIIDVVEDNAVESGDPLARSSDSGVDLAEEAMEQHAVPTNSRYNLRTNRRPTWKMAMVIEYAIALVAKNGNVYGGAKAVENYGMEGITSMMSEMKQLHDKRVFHAVKQMDLTPKQRLKVLTTLMFLRRKRNGKLKSRFAVNGKKQDRSLAAVDPNSPTVSNEALFISFAIDALEKRIVLTIDIEGAYLHVKMKGEVIIRIDPFIADLLINIDPMYAQFVDQSGFLYMMLDKALYGCVESARLFYDHLAASFVSLGFVVNPYDRCVFNKIVNEDGMQCTITVHVDDLKVSCKDGKFLQKFVEDLSKIYGKLNVHTEKVLDYLGMDVDYTQAGVVKISMVKMVQSAIDDFEKEEPVESHVSTPANDDLFNVDDSMELLSVKRKELFHSLVAKLLYMSKRARPDILTAVAFLTTRVLNPNIQDWYKLKRLMKYLYGTRNLCLNITTTQPLCLQAYVDASFACHPDRKGHTGIFVTLGGGCIYGKSTKQKLVARSSTEAELIALGDSIPILLWMRLYLLAQGYVGLPPIVVFQDNLSTITLVKKGRSSSSRTRHIDIRYFFVHDKLVSGEIEVRAIGTLDMTGDYFSKALQGLLFIKMVKKVMGSND